MCIEYARVIPIKQFLPLVRDMGVAPPLVWTEPTPSPASAQFHIRIGDDAMVARLEPYHLAGEMLSWGWRDGRQVVFNLKAETCDFSRATRALILATGFYEYAEPIEAKQPRQERFLITMKAERWFWIAGVVRQGRFAMLTTRPGPDIRHYHNRQPCLLTPMAGFDWLASEKPREELLRPSPRGTLAVRMAQADHSRYQLN